MNWQDRVVICPVCSFQGTIQIFLQHSCDCCEDCCEDYPCCGHADGGGCQTTPEMTSEYEEEDN